MVYGLYGCMAIWCMGCMGLYGLYGLQGRRDDDSWMYGCMGGAVASPADVEIGVKA